MHFGLFIAQNTFIFVCCKICIIKMYMDGFKDDMVVGTALFLERDVCASNSALELFLFVLKYDLEC